MAKNDKCARSAVRSLCFLGFFFIIIILFLTKQWRPYFWPMRLHDEYQAMGKKKEGGGGNGGVSSNYVYSFSMHQQISLRISKCF